MTNRELLRAAPETLSSVDRQRRHVLGVAAIPVPCPACLAPVDAVAAAGLDVDQYAFGAALDRVTPLVAFGPGWHWTLNLDWLAERLDKARKYDAEHPEG